MAAGAYYNVWKGQLLMIKKISVLLLAIALLLSVPACTMPDAIFSDSVNSGGEDDGTRDSADIYSFMFNK